MIKKPRADKRKNIGKVAEVLAEDPNKTVREIAKETCMSVGAVHSSKKEVEQSGTKDETIAYIVSSAKERIKKASKVFDQIVDDAVNAMFNADGSRKTEIVSKGGIEVEEPTNIGVKEKALLKDIVKDDMARVTVLGGNATDKDGGLKDTIVNVIVQG